MGSIKGHLQKKIKLNLEFLIHVLSAVGLKSLLILDRGIHSRSVQTFPPIILTTEGKCRL